MTSTTMKKCLISHTNSWRQRFDRFGDDLCQLLLSYLSLEDRLRCECVCKQWQSVIFNTQTEFNSNFDYRLKQLNDKTLEMIVKKCTNITTICFWHFRNPMNDSLLLTIIRHCHRLTDIKIRRFGNISDKVLDQFFKRFAKQLKTISMHFYECIEKFRQNKRQIIAKNIKFCTNIQFIDIQYQRGFNNAFSLITEVYNNNEVMFKKLNRLEFDYSNKNADNFDLFVANYKKQIKSIEICVKWYCSEQALDLLINRLSQISSLIDIHMTYFIQTQTLGMTTANHLEIIGKNCKQLKRFGLTLAMPPSFIGDLNDNHLYQIDYLNHIIQAINNFMRQIKQLKLLIRFYMDYSVESDSFNGLKQLTHLSISSNTVLNSIFFDNIDINLPSLEYISIDHIMIKPEAMKRLSKIPKLSSIVFNGVESYK